MANPQLLIEVAAKDETTKILKGIESSIIRFVGAVSASLAAISVVAFPITVAAEFQKELLNVAKTTEFTGEQIERLGAGLQDLSTRLNVSALDLAKVASAGGQLGLGKAGGVEGILAYTETTARFASVLNVTVEEAGTGIGKLSNLFGIAIKDAERISSTLNEISNNSTASGRELIDIIQRIGTAGGTLTLQQSAALAAYGKDLGLTSETVGTTLNKIFLDLQSKAKEVAPLVGLTVTEFANLVKTDGVAAFKLYLDSLKKMDNVSRAIISEQITGGGRIAAFVTAAINDASTGFKLLNKELESTKKGFDEGTSAIKEQERVMTGLLAQLTILKNIFTNIAETIGRAALPYLTDLTKQLQELGKNPELVAFFTDTAKAIGAMVAGVISVVQYLSSFSAIVGPLLRLLEVFIALKLVQALVGIGRSLFGMGAAVTAAASGWAQLITLNQAAIASMAAAANAVNATNAALVAQGRAATTTVSVMGKAAQGLAGFFAPVTDAQNAAARAEKLLNDRLQQRLTVMGAIAQRTQELQRTPIQVGQAAYADAIAAGATKKAAADARRIARADRTAQAAQIKQELADLNARGAALANTYQQSINRLTAAYTASTAQAVVMGNTVAGVMLRIAATARTAAIAVFRLGQGFIAVAGRIIGALFILQFIADAFGVLDPILSFFKTLFGIRTEADAKAAKAARDRDAALAEEQKKAATLAAEYQKVASTWDTQDASPLGVGLADLAGRLDIIRGKMADITFKAQEFANGIAYSADRSALLSARITEAKARLATLEKDKGKADILNSAVGAVLPIAKIDVDRQAKQIEKARAELTKLETEYSLVQKAQEHYAKSVADSSDALDEAQGRESATLANLATAYSAEGFAFLKQLEVKLSKQKELAEAEKLLRDAETAKDDQSSDSKKLAAFTLLEQKVRSLTAEYKVLGDGVTETFKQSSISAVAFLSALGVSDTLTDLTKVSAAVRQFGAISGEGTAALNRTLSEATKEAGLLGEALAVASSERTSMLRLIADEEKAGTLSQRGAAKAIAETNEKYNLQLATLRDKLGVQKAIEESARREIKTAELIRTSQEGADEATKKRATAEGVVARLLAASAKLAILKPQITEREDIVARAKSTAERIKAAYESSIKDVSTAIANVSKDMAEIGRVLSGRRLTLKLATFDTNAERQGKLIANIQSDMVDEERKRLEALGLSSEEIKRQMRDYEQMLEIANKMRQETQDEQRQAVILNDLRAQIAESEKQAVEHQRAAASLTKEHVEAVASGDKGKAETVGKRIAVEAELATEALDTMKAKVKEFQGEASKPINNVFGAGFKVAEKELTDMTRRAAEVNVEVRQSVSKSFGQASIAAADEVNKQNAELSLLGEKLTNLNKEILTIVGKDAELAKVAGLVGEAMLKQSEGIASSVASLKSIANADFQGITSFSSLADKAPLIKSIEDSIDNIATQSAQKIISLTEKTAELPRALKAVFEITQAQLEAADAAAKAQAERASTVRSTAEKQLGEKPATVPVIATGVRDSVQGQLDTKPFGITVEPRSGGVPGRAEGGHIRGPGTGTSDSILSWLSNGEFVSDAKTTSFFGPAFFSTLKSIARSGPAAAARFFSAFAGGPRLPAFAGGGPVSTSLAGSAAQALSSFMGDAAKDTVNVNFEMGGRKIALRAERDQANDLVRTVRNLSRSS